MKKRICIFLSLSIMLAFACKSRGNLPISVLMKSDEKIANHLEIQVGKGAQYSHVKAELQNIESWDFFEANHGYSNTGNPSDAIGKFYIRANVGQYNAPFTTVVTAWFVFDDKKVITNVFVRRSTDSL